MADRLVAKRYRLGRKIGTGSFGEVYIGTDARTGDTYAMKLEHTKRIKHPQLAFESKVFKLLQGGTGIPTIHHFGKEGHYNVLVMQRLGTSLEELFHECGGRFSVKTVLMIADQALARLEYLHSKGIIHRDIKPDNFMIGYKDDGPTLYIIDFGLSKCYRDPRTKVHIEYREKKQLTGTPRYASINNHLGIEQSRRDDLESLGYVMLYFLRGKLPWQGIPAKTRREKYQKIAQTKMATLLEELNAGFPEEFASFLKYCRTLRFASDPDYADIRAMFRRAAERIGVEYDGQFDWVVKRAKAKAADDESKSSGR